MQKNESNYSIPVVSTRLSEDYHLYSPTPIYSAKDAVNVIKDYIGTMASETSYALYLDNALRPICASLIGCGQQAMMSISIRDTVRNALFCNATFITLIHNHPDGIIKPSAEDITVVTRLINVCAPLNLKVYDSIIVSTKDGSEKLYSIKDKSGVFKQFVPLTDQQIKKWDPKEYKEIDEIPWTDEAEASITSELKKDGFLESDDEISLY